MGFALAILGQVEGLNCESLNLFSAGRRSELRQKVRVSS
jgi:hypothetical protein